MFNSKRVSSQVIALQSELTHANEELERIRGLLVRSVNLFIKTKRRSKFYEQCLKELCAAHNVETVKDLLAHYNITLDDAA